MNKELEELHQFIDTLNETQIAYILRLLKKLFGGG